MGGREAKRGAGRPRRLRRIWSGRSRGRSSSASSGSSSRFRCSSRRWRHCCPAVCRGSSRRGGGWAGCPRDPAGEAEAPRCWARDELPTLICSPARYRANGPGCWASRAHAEGVGSKRPGSGRSGPVRRRDRQRRAARGRYPPRGSDLRSCWRARLRCICTFENLVCAVAGGSWGIPSAPRPGRTRRGLRVIIIGHRGPALRRSCGLPDSVMEGRCRPRGKLILALDAAEFFSTS